MASVRKKTGSSGRISPYWMARYMGPDGRLWEKTTKQTDRKKAQAVAETLEIAARKAKAGELTQVAILKSMGELMERTTGEKLNVITVRDFFAEWMQSKETVGRAAGTLKRYRPILNGFLLHIGERRAAASVGSITPTEIERFRDAQLTEGKGATTANFAVNILRSVLATARKKGVSLSNPADAIESLDAEAEERDPFTEEQTRALLKAARETDWTGMILFAWNTGIRLGDAANLTWANIDLKEGTLSYREEKTVKRKKGREKETVVCLHRDVQNWLKTRPKGNQSQLPLFPTLYGKSSGSYGGLSNAFSSIMDRALVCQPERGINRVERTGKGRQFRALGFHSFRHAFISRLANADVSADVRKSITGHSSDVVHRRYTHLELDTQRRAIDLLPGIEG